MDKIFSPNKKSIPEISLLFPELFPNHISYKLKHSCPKKTKKNVQKDTSRNPRSTKPSTLRQAPSRCHRSGNGEAGRREGDRWAEKPVGGGGKPPPWKTGGSEASHVLLVARTRFPSEPRFPRAFGPTLGGPLHSCCRLFSIRVRGW